MPRILRKTQAQGWGGAKAYRPTFSFEVNVTPKMLKELQDIFAEAARTEMWGTVEIDFQRGVPVVIRQTRSKKLEVENNSHAKPAFR